MRKASRSFTYLPLLATAGALFATGVMTARADRFPVDSGSIWAWVYNQTNDYRASNGLPRLTFAPSVKDVAQFYADYQASTGTSGHQADGRSPGQRLDAAGLRYCGYAENVFEIWAAPGVPTWRTAATAAMEFWKHSPGHNANLLSATMTSMGVGSAGWTYANGRNTYKVVQLFIDDCGSTGPRVKTLGKQRG